MNSLEKMIRENREKFDSVEPLDGHFERFAERLGPAEEVTATRTMRFGLLKAAAVILILITGATLVFDLTTRSVRDRFFSPVAGTQLNPELAEAIQYYDTKANVRLKEARTLAADPAQAAMINETARKEMAELDENTRELEKSLAENPNCERLQSAILQNQQMKEDIMNTIVNKLTRN